jgi:hypothetical protein
MTSSVEIPTITNGELQADAIYDGGTFALKFVGSADSDSQSSIKEMLARVHEEALRLQVPEVQVDFRRFHFINSACFKEFVEWLGRVQDLANSAQYKIRFLSDEAKTWQRRSLGALHCFAVDLVEIESGKSSVPS